jgi:hypothetical protein
VSERNYCSRTCLGADKTRRKIDVQIEPDGLTARIALHDRFGNVRAYALIDAADAEWAAQWPWCLSGGDGYAYRRDRVTRQTIKLHRALLGLTFGDGMEGDHIDRDKLNCRRSNLRPLPKAGGANAQNRGNFSGSGPGQRQEYLGRSVRHRV